MVEVNTALSKARKKRVIPDSVATPDDIAGYTLLGSHPVHSARSGGIHDIDLHPQQVVACLFAHLAVHLLLCNIPGFVRPALQSLLCNISGCACLALHAWLCSVPGLASYLALHVWLCVPGPLLCFVGGMWKCLGCVEGVLWQGRAN